MRGLFRSAALLWLLAPGAALALPQGEWMADFYGQIGVIAITDKTFVFDLSDKEKAIGFAGPLAQVQESEGGKPGRMIVGPVEGGKFPYEVVWFQEPVGPRAFFFCEATGYKTLAEAEASRATYESDEASLFLSKPYFEKVDALPVLPPPGRAQLVMLLEEALRRYKTNPQDTNTLMENLMVDKGYHPTKSREPFEASLQQYSSDPDVSRLLAELMP